MNFKIMILILWLVIVGCDNSYTTKTVNNKTEKGYLIKITGDKFLEKGKLKHKENFIFKNDKNKIFKV
ncbi:MAG: hypothetical protein DSZ07_03720, partial [Sulfurovum sp.]